jgi:hypothetical protein
MNRPTLSVSGAATEVVASNGSVVLHVPIALKRRSGRRVVVPAGSEATASRTTATPLQLALARGHRWLRMLETGEAASMCDIARREGANHSYIARQINLTLLSPDIVAAILDETLPGGGPTIDAGYQSVDVVGPADAPHVDTRELSLRIPLTSM